MNGGNVIDDNFKKTSIKTQLENVSKLMDTGFEPWEEETNRVIVTQLVENIEKLLVGKATRSTVVNSRGEVKHRIIIEYD